MSFSDAGPLATQFSADAASDGIIDHILESMPDYDCLARPVKHVPLTLQAMPEFDRLYGAAHRLPDAHGAGVGLRL